MRRFRYRLKKLLWSLFLIVTAVLIGNQVSQQEGKPGLQDLLPPTINITEQTPQEGSNKDVIKVSVVTVLDGDTFIANYNGEETRIRLIGVDTPESVNKTNPELNCEEGRIASNYTKQLLTGKDVWLEWDKQMTDDYERVLAYVYLDEAKTDMVQDRLLADGMAHCMSIKPNIKYANHFAEIEEQARKSAAGFWETDFWTRG